MIYLSRYLSISFCVEEIMNYVYKFPVVKGIQADKEYYIAMVPLKMLPKLFPVSEEEYIPPEYRAQRKINETRIPVISKYILDNRDSYVFSALAASIDGQYTFIPYETSSELGILEVEMDAKFLINDGQHRKSAILEALKEDESLGDETISIVFYADKGLARSQQIFTDLNKNAVKTSNSIAELYDSRDEMAVVTRKVVRNIEFLDTYTDKEKDILGKFSSSLFTLNTFYVTNKTIIGRSSVANAEKFLKEFWENVVSNMRQWEELQNHEITKVDLREGYIAIQSIVIQALGRIGNYYYSVDDSQMAEDLKKLRDINWNRNSKQWTLRAVGKNGRIITNKKAAMLIANVIKQQIGIPLSEDEEAAERKLKKELEG